MEVESGPPGPDFARCQTLAARGAIFSITAERRLNLALRSVPRWPKTTAEDPGPSRRFLPVAAASRLDSKLLPFSRPRIRETQNKGIKIPGPSRRRLLWPPNRPRVRPTRPPRAARLLEPRPVSASPSSPSPPY